MPSATLDGPMNDYENDSLSDLQIVADEITQMHKGARVEKHQIKPGSWVVTIETDDKFVRGEGATEAMAFGALIKNAKAEGWAPRKDES
jgi:hypothetical protein